MPIPLLWYSCIPLVSKNILRPGPITDEDQLQLDIDQRPNEVCEVKNRAEATGHVSVKDVRVPRRVFFLSTPYYGYINRLFETSAVNKSLKHNISVPGYILIGH